jgi:serine/threonine protein kinase
MLPPGTRVGRYELVRRLAKGGMAELYLARAHGIHGFEKLVVFKLVLPYLAEDREFVEMFLHEARLAATLDHPNIVHVTDIGEVAGEPFFVMEYVHGQDVRAIMRAASKAGKPLPLSVGLAIVAGAATGLHYVHERRGPDGKFLGLVHRDVSPANVVVSYDGSVKLVDFGIAKATELRQTTRSGVLKGKVNYMAPEQCHGIAVDRRTDVFALGILLYETTTGKRLFAGDSDFYVMSRIVRGLFARPTEVRPDLPPELESIILRALATDPDDRHATAQELLADLESFAHEHRIRLSALTVSDFLSDLFGEQPHPATEEDELPTMLHPDALGSDPRGSAPQMVGPTSVSTFAEATTSVSVPPGEASGNAVAPTATPPATDAPTRVLGPSADTGEVTAALPAVAANTVVVPRTEPSPRVVLEAPRQVATVPTPRVIIARPRSTRPRKQVGLIIGLGLAAIVAFAIGVSAGKRQRNQAAPTTTPTPAATEHAAPSVTPAPAEPPEVASDLTASPTQDVSPTDLHGLPKGDDDRSDPVDVAAPEQAPSEVKRPRPAKKKRPPKQDSEPKKPSGLDGMYPSTSRSGR